jgi:hypothetical protein
MPHYHFCTYFDKNYLFKGLALYRSLEQHMDKFTLWILCFDELTHKVLQKMGLERAKLIALEDFERGDEALLEAKGNRSHKEYLWTVTPSLPLYILKKQPDLDSIAYLDADLFFFSNPDPVYREFAGHSILIIEHRYAPPYAHYVETSGIYNVEMLIFRNDEIGVESLNWWRDRCNEWCFDRIEDGKMGDQKYLDDWPSRFEQVMVLKNKGAGLAPWNVSNYTLRVTDGKTMVDTDELIFYHFHNTFLRSDWIIELSPTHEFTGQQIDLIYKPYVRGLKAAIREVRQIAPNFRHGVNKLDFLRMMKRLLRRRLLFTLGHGIWRL